MLGAGNGPGTGVCVDPAPPLPGFAALPLDPEFPPLATELTEANDKLAVDEEAVVAELDDADAIAGHCRS